MISAEQIAYKLLEKFQEAITKGEYADLPHRQELAQALSILVDLRNNRFEQAISNACLFGYHLAKHGDLENIDAEITEEEQEELIKRCINCNSLTASGGTLKCKLEKCKYEK